jgi:5-methylcytosine-specific restriction endonuclease McrA
VHHRVEHQGDASLFFDPLNLESLCVRCHEKEHKRGATSRAGRVESSETTSRNRFASLSYTHAE